MIVRPRLSLSSGRVVAGLLLLCGCAAAFSHGVLEFLRRTEERQGPGPLGNLWSTGWGRSELAAQLYDEILFNGATVDLPAAFRSGLNDPVDIGVGSVHRIDNPRGQARHDR